MARSFNGSSDKATASLPSLTDFSISVWLKPNSTPSGTQSVVAWDNFPSSPRNYLVIQQSTAGSSGNINVDVGVAGTGGSSVMGAATLSSGTWYQMGASRASTTCKAWKDGAQIGASWTVGSGSFTPSAFRFGCHNFSSSDQEFAPVTIAEGGLWSVELTVAEWAALAKGVSPKLIRPQSLVACWPLIGRASPEPDLRGGYNLTLTGTSQAAHPRVYYPGRRRTVFVPGAGGNTDYTANLSGSVTPSGAIAKAVAQPRTGTLTHTGSLTRASAQSRTGSLTTSGVITKAGAKPLAGTATTGGALTRATSQTRTGSVTLTGLLTRATAKGLTGALSLTGAVTKAIARALAGSVTPSGSFVAGSLFTKALTGAVTLTGAAVVKATAKTVTGTVTASGSVLRAIAKALTGLLSLTGLFSKSGGSGDLADLPPGGVIRRADTRRVIRPVAPPGRVVRRADVRRNFPD